MQRLVAGIEFDARFLDREKRTLREVVGDGHHCYVRLMYYLAKPRKVGLTTSCVVVVIELRAG